MPNSIAVFNNFALDINKMHIVNYPAKRERFFSWTEEYTRTPFHGRGICKICDDLINKTLKEDKNIEPYFTCEYRTLFGAEEPLVVIKTAEADPLNIYEALLAGFLGSFVFFVCVVALYYPISHLCRRLKQQK
ncbi:hypothetical protein PFISCL1PPCAC_26861, partial [Pristionchus fissidentatus]